MLSKERQKVLVVLLADPERRHACRVKSVTEDALICRHRRGEVAYSPEQIAAVVEPHSRLGPLLWVGADFAVAAGSVTGIVLLASVSTAVLVGGGIPLGVLAVAALVDAAFAIEGDCGVNAFSSAHDVVLYRSASLATAVVSR